MNTGVFEGQSCNHQDLMGLWKINQGPLQTASSATIKMKGHAPSCCSVEAQIITKRPKMCTGPARHHQRGSMIRLEKQTSTKQQPGRRSMKVNANPEKVSRNTCAEKGRSCKNQNE